MKCPHCNYEHGWSPDALDSVTGDVGDFFSMPSPTYMERSNEYNYNTEQRSLYGCPKCNKIFMDYMSRRYD